MANILIVDDDEMDRLLERRFLEDAGHTPFFASDGESELRVYQANDIDVVVTDMRMPNVDGQELIQRLLEIDPKAAIIAVSGTATELDKAEGVGRSGLDREAKPPRRTRVSDRRNAKPLGRERGCLGSQLNSSFLAERVDVPRELTLHARCPIRVVETARGRTVQYRDGIAKFGLTLFGGLGLADLLDSSADTRSLGPVFGPGCGTQNHPLLGALDVRHASLGARSFRLLTGQQS